MKLRRNKKGFTIIELVIVIAVIGILAAVLIPTFVNLTNKANEASDNALVNNLNKALKMEEQELGHKKAETLEGAIVDLEHQGYLLENLATKSGKDLIWSQSENQFLLNTENKTGKDYWKIVDAVPEEKANQKYSYYAGKNFNQTNVTVAYGFDAGRNDGIAKVTYEGNVNHTAQEVAIRTNGGNVTITAPVDTVNHYGEASVVSIKKAATESYHLFGEITVKMTVEDGRAVVEKGGKVATLEVAKGAQEIVAASGSKVENLNIASDADIQSAKLQVESGSEVKVVVNNSATVETTAIEEAGVIVVDPNSEAAQGKTMYNITRNEYYTSSTMLGSGDCILLSDLNMQLAQGAVASSCSLDLNGHSITNSTSGRPVVSAARSGKYLEIKGNGELIQTLTDSNATVIKISNENVKIGEGVKMSGGAVGIFLTGESRAHTVEFAGQYATTQEDSFGIYRNGTLKDTEKCPTVTIKKTAKIDVADGAAIYAAGYAIWNIKGGEFKSQECLEFKSGILNISGGRFEATVEEPSHTPNGNGTSACGYALAAIWNDGYAKPLTVTLDGGTFVGPVAKLNDSDDPSKINSIVFNNNLNVPLA